MREKYLAQIKRGFKCTNSYGSSQETMAKLEKDSVAIANQSTGLFFIEKEKYNFWRLYFYISDIDIINWNIFKGKELVTEIIVRNSKKEIWKPVVKKIKEKGSFKKYATFIRLYSDKLDIDNQNVDFSKIENPSGTDFKEIQKLLEKNFDVLSDRIPSIEALMKIKDSSFVLKEKGKIAGLFLAEKNGLTLIFRYWLVLEEHRGKKYGDLLMKRVLTFDPEIKRVTSWINKKQHYSILAHKRLGFKEDGLTNYILHRA